MRKRTTHILVYDERHFRKAIFAYAPKNVWCIPAIGLEHPYIFLIKPSKDSSE